MELIIFVHFIKGDIKIQQDNPKNRMYRHTKLTQQQQSYIEDIKLAQNKLRVKLPYILSYRADRHFEYLAAGGDITHKPNKISRKVLEQLIPYQNDYEQFQPGLYLDDAIMELNGDGVHDGLLYGGYLNLITTYRNCNSRGSQVNKTLFNRITLNHELNTKFTTTSEKDNKAINSIIGMLLFLECLRFAEQNRYNYQLQLGRQAGENTIRKADIKQNEGKFGNDKFNDMETVYHRNVDKKYGRGLLLDNRIKQIQQNKSLHHINPQQTVRKRSRKPIFESTNKQKQPSSKPLLTLEQQYYQTQTPNDRAGDELKIEFLQNFSSQQNVWQNISERNLHAKFRTPKTHDKSREDSAFYIEPVYTPRKFYAKSPTTGSGKILNRMWDAYYQE